MDTNEIRLIKRNIYDYDYSKLILVLIVFLLLHLVLTPLVYMCLESITDESGRITINNYLKVLSRPNNVIAIRNSFLLSTMTAIFSVLIGVPLAFGVSRTNMGGKNLTKAAVIISIITPQFLLSMAYIILVGPSVGYINLILRSIFNLSNEMGPLSIYTLTGLILLTIPSGVSFVFLQTSSAFENINPSLEESARMLGGNKLKTSLTISIPLVKPAILSGALLAFSNSLALYGIPYMLNINVIVTSIRQSMLMNLDFNSAAVLAVISVILSMLALYLYLKNVKSLKRYQTISARGYRSGVMHLGNTRHIFTLLGYIYGFFSFVLPYGSLVLVSFFKNIGDGPTLQNLTLNNYYTILNSPLARMGVANSFILGVATATIVVFIGIIGSYIIIRKKIKGKSLLEYISIIPMGIPGTALAAGLIIVYLSKPLNKLNIYGTLWILLIAYITRMIPLGIRYCQSAFIQIDEALEETARICGASWLKTIRDITLPIIKPGIIYAWIMVFVRTFPELGTSVMLRNVGTDVVATAILDIWAGGLAQAAALGSIIFLIVTGAILIFQKALIEPSKNKTIKTF